MALLQLISALGKNDARLIRRDSFLLLLFGIVIVMGIGVGYAMPWLDGVLIDKGILPNESIDLRLADVYPMLMAYFTLFQGATIAGTIFGFMLLDEKDNDTLLAMRVTPVPMERYLSYRVAVPTACALVFIPVLYQLIGLAPIAPWQLALLTLGGALAAPITTLFFAIVATNKVQGFAMSKFVSVAGWIIIGGWFVPEPFQWLLGIFPPFFIAKSYWLLLDGDSLWLAALIAGVIAQLALIIGMVRHFKGQVV